MQRGITQISSFIYINASVDESFGSRKVTPSDNIVKSIIAVTVACIHIRKISFGKAARVAQLGKYSFFSSSSIDKPLTPDPLVEELRHQFQRLFRFR